MTILRVGYAPVFFVGFLAAALVLSDGGTRPLPLAGLLAAAILVSALVERILPYEPRFNASHGDRDLAHAIVNEAANTASVLAMPLVVALVPARDGWPDNWPVVAELALAILIADVGITFAHWASHRVELLWRFHAVHHSVERLYGFNGLMKHPFH